jgi:DNA-binding beta-propeller fold protein YncE
MIVAIAPPIQAQTPPVKSRAIKLPPGNSAPALRPKPSAAPKSALERQVASMLSEIALLERSYAEAKVLLAAKQAELRRTNPLFAPKDEFESDAEYVARSTQARPLLLDLEKEHLEPIRTKLAAQRAELISTREVQVSLESYDANNEVYSLKVTHLAFNRETHHLSVPLARDRARLLHQNRERIQATGLLAIDPGDEVRLTRVRIDEPNSGFETVADFRESLPLAGKDLVAISPDGRLVATVANREGVAALRVIDVAEGRERYSIQPDQDMTSLKFSPDGTYLAVGLRGGKVMGYQPATGRKRFELTTENTVCAFDITAEGAYLATSSYGGSVELFKVDSQARMARFSIDGEWQPLTMSRDGKVLVTVSDEGGSRADVRVFDFATQAEVMAFRHEDKVQAIALSPDGKTLATSSGYNRDHTVKVFDLDSEKLLLNLHQDDAVGALAFSPDGKFLALAAGTQAKVFDVASQVEVFVLPQEERAGAVTFSPDGRYLLTPQAMYRTLFAPYEPLVGF